MGVSDICHISAWLTDRADLGADMAARDAFLPASPLRVVADVPPPEFKGEVWAAAGLQGPDRR